MDLRGEQKDTRVLKDTILGFPGRIVDGLDKSLSQDSRLIRQIITSSRPKLHNNCYCRNAPVPVTYVVLVSLKGKLVPFNFERNAERANNLLLQASGNQIHCINDVCELSRLFGLAVPDKYTVSKSVKILNGI